MNALRAILSAPSFLAKQRLVEDALWELTGELSPIVDRLNVLAALAGHAVHRDSPVTATRSYYSLHEPLVESPHFRFAATTAASMLIVIVEEAPHHRARVVLAAAPGVVPAPDPVAVLASALSSQALVDEACETFARAVEWCRDYVARSNAEYESEPAPDPVDCAGS